MFVYSLYYARQPTKNPVLKPAKYLQGGTRVAQALLTVIFEVVIRRNTFQSRLRHVESHDCPMFFTILAQYVLKLLKYVESRENILLAQFKE